MTGPADSAGIPWHGRTFTPSGFETDDGSADPRITALLAAGTESLRELVAALPGTRLLVPVVAHLGEGQGAGDVAVHGDKSADMATVTLAAPDGRRTLPVFSSMRTLAAWNASARPVPVEARQAALAAVQEGCELLLIDAVGPHRVVVPRPALWAIAKGEPWVPVLEDREVLLQIASTVRSASELILAAHCAAGRRAELAVVVTLPPNLTPRHLDEVTGVVSRVLAGLEVVAERVDSVELRFTG